MRSNNTVDEQIASIIAGNEKEIIRGISSDSPIVQLNALIYGTKNHVSDLKFTEGVKSIVQTSNVRFFGVPFKKYAMAALDVLKIQEYNGDDDFIQRLIQSEFQIV